MTTANQIAWKQLKETERTNRAKEDETKRSNKAKEGIGIADSVIKGVTGIGKVMGSINDPSWYNRDPQLVKDVASISFNTPLGNAFSNELGKVKVPGINVIRFIPAIGSTSASLGSNVMNVAAKNIYAYVRYANSGSRNYEAPDLMMYLLAMDQIYSYWAHLRRIYSLALTSKAHNRYYLDGMLQACGVNPADIRANLASLRAYINTFAMRANAFYVPKSLTVFLRHIWLNSNIFKDQPVRKSQDYLFLQEFYFIYDDKHGILGTSITPDGGGVVTFAPHFRPLGNKTFDDLRLDGDYLLQNLVDSEDIGVMSGDILKAYGEGNMFMLPNTPEDYHIESVYSPEVLSQIQGTTLVQYLNDSNSRVANYLAIRQDENGNIYQGHAFYNSTSDKNPSGYGVPVCLGMAGYDWITGETGMPTGYQHRDGVLENHIVNMYKDDVTPDDVMVATRNTAAILSRDVIWNKTSGDTDYNKATDALVIYGTEIFNDSIILNLSDDGSSVVKETDTHLITWTGDLDGALNTLRPITKFDWHPMVYFTTSPAELKAANYYIDMANYTSISNDVLSNLHYVAALSEFGVNDLGVKVRSRT